LRRRFDRGQVVDQVGTKYLVEIYNININFLMVHVNVSRRNSYRVNIVTNFIQKVHAQIKKDLTCILYSLTERFTWIEFEGQYKQYATTRSGKSSKEVTHDEGWGPIQALEVVSIVPVNVYLVMLATALHGNTSPIFFSNTKYTIP